MGHSLSLKKGDWGDGIVALGITYNLSDMYYLVLKNCGYGHIDKFGQELDNKKLKDIKPMLVAMYNELISNPKLYKKYNSENGRGSYDGLLNTISKVIIKSCETPNDILLNFY